MVILLLGLSAVHVSEYNQSNPFRVKAEFEFGDEVLLMPQSVSDSDHH